jgi:hypothetical protein
MTDSRLSLRDVLVDLAEDARPVDLSAAVKRRAGLLRRRRAALGGAAAVGVLGASSAVAVQLTATRDVGQAVGGPAIPRTDGTGWFAYTPLTSPGGPVLASGYPTPSVAISPSATAGSATAPCPTFNDFSDASVTVAEKARATAMGTYLCSALGGGAKFGQLEEWVSTGGLSGGYPGRVYNIQAHHPGIGAGNPTEQGEIWISVYQDKASPTSTGVQVSDDGETLSATWPDGTVVHMEAGKDTPANRAIVGNPVFDAFGS